MKYVIHRLYPTIFLLVSFSLFIPDAASAQEKKFTRDDYKKSEHRIAMRDGIKLYTAVYRPKDTTRTYPILMIRTPYSCRPYNTPDFTDSSFGNPYLIEAGYIFVCQDVRGRWMSEGDYTTMTPNRESPDQIDESSDTYDTIEWLLKNIPNHNGKVGQWGISYPGFYTAAALPDAHPALVASSPQAPIADFFFDDFHHHGAYFLSYWQVTPLFGIQQEGPVDTSWYSMPDVGTDDDFHFYYHLGPLKNSERYFREDNFFWNELKNHPNYDAFWQARNILPHLQGIDHAVLTVGGWFDAQDLYGPLNIYKNIEANNPKADNRIIMGPWGHGDWSRGEGPHLVGDIYYGDNLSDFFKRNLEFPFFQYHLKGIDSLALPEALMFDTGRKQWTEFDSWPPKNARKHTFYIHGNERLDSNRPQSSESRYTEFVSDLEHPVPFTQEIDIGRLPDDAYMTEDQRFAARRPDVLTFETEPLKGDLTLAGDILANLHVSTTGTAADWVVKLIDVYPASYPENEHTPEGVELDYYQQMVRSEVIRGRFRNSYSEPEPFESGKVTYVDLPLQDVYHTFRKGHKIMIHIQSTWFPLIDLNPQKYVENIFEAEEDDFINTTHQVFHSPEYPTSIEVMILPGR
ncbi:MAG: CocE/NonD family hydrolase [Balneolaceae bacterium]|nr:CocE/NonD family hydrolase [Balneolaceae bacterium]